MWDIICVFLFLYYLRIFAYEDRFLEIKCMDEFAMVAIQNNTYYFYLIDCLS